MATWSERDQLHYMNKCGSLEHSLVVDMLEYIVYTKLHDFTIKPVRLCTFNDKEDTLPGSPPLYDLTDV